MTNPSRSPVIEARLFTASLAESDPEIGRVIDMLAFAPQQIFGGDRQDGRDHKGPEDSIHALCSVIENLAPAIKRTWHAARKHFDIGYELRSSERSSRFTLRPDTLERVARLGARLTVTYYRERNAEPNTPPKRGPARKGVTRRLREEDGGR